MNETWGNPKRGQTTAQLKHLRVYVVHPDGRVPLGSLRNRREEVADPAPRFLDFFPYCLCPPRIAQTTWEEKRRGTDRKQEGTRKQHGTSLALWYN